MVAVLLFLYTCGQSSVTKTTRSRPRLTHLVGSLIRRSRSNCRCIACALDINLDLGEPKLLGRVPPVRRCLARSFLMGSALDTGAGRVTTSWRYRKRKRACSAGRGM